MPLKSLAFLLLCLFLAFEGAGPASSASPLFSPEITTSPEIPVSAALNTVPGADPSQFRYFDETGHSLSGSILRFYNRTGGQERHGLPVSELIQVRGKYQQYFERSLLEFSPEYAGTDYEVRVSPLGTLETTGRTFAPAAPFPNTPDQWYFPESGHSLTRGFLNYWRNHGERDSLGLPISEELTETGDSGQKLTVQYFENVRLESPSGAPAPESSIQISLLGKKRAATQLTPGDLLNVPLARLNQPRILRVPSLMFHYLRIVDPKKDLLGFGLSIYPDNFVKFLDWIQENGYHTVTVAQIGDYLRYGIPLPEKPVNIRFDDGHADQWFGYQEMKKRNMTATYYVITQRLELLPSQWQQIDQDGFEVTAHTRTHPDLRGVGDLEGEIAGSKRDIEAILGHPVRSFAYPYGKYNNAIVQVVKDSGFEIAVSTNGGYAWSPDNYFIEPVISVTGDDNVASFAAKIRGASSAPFTNYIQSDTPSAPAPTAKGAAASGPKTPVPPTPAKKPAEAAPKATPTPLKAKPAVTPRT